MIQGAWVPLWEYRVGRDKITCRRRMKAEAKKWAKCYKNDVDFPEPKLVPIPPGSIVFTDENTSDFVGKGYSYSDDRTCVTISDNPKQEGRHIQWRLYMVDMLLHETDNAAGVPHPERFTYRRAYLSFVCRYPWGAVCAAVRDCLLNAIEFTVPRIEGVLRFWEALDTLKYIDLYERPISLAELVAFHFNGAIAMWVDNPTGNIRTDLQTAIDQMRAASEDEIWGRLVKRLRAYVDIAKDLQHREWLKSPGVIEEELVAFQNNRFDTYEDLTTGHLRTNGSFLYHLDKKCPGTVH